MLLYEEWRHREEERQRIEAEEAMKREAEAAARGREAEAAYMENLKAYDLKQRALEELKRTDPAAFLKRVMQPEPRELYTLNMQESQAVAVMRQCYTLAVNGTGRAVVDTPRVRFQVDKCGQWIVNAGNCRRLQPVKDAQGNPLKDAQGNALKESVFKNGLILRGGVGTGKTTLMQALKTAIDTFDTAGRRLAIATAWKLANMQRDSKQAFEEWKRRPLLAIDDLGTEPATVKDYGNDNTPLAELLTYRYERRLFTVITTNLDERRIEEIYGRRVGDRLKELCHSITFGSQSYRL